ncbi:nicotinate-nucleotide--dimethylbenzimidazole phosphoribosyltransferase [Thiomicrorhabdus aquaedulcis]|uniref:nicotinate-nucleotide--dimethylbenzimidazole phosphoribosyltransferase n=1 Tax=Thiomicrorhabdus aquaedulcis TaxID=2211106 RepID=UPI000FDC7FCC|nr:nicotinate-nucleotide--dimethylbenzimidazole phosphoribosyltransferase [Thiomicrorhabdus aquaedulcis]
MQVTLKPIKSIDQAWSERAAIRQQSLTKPAGSLGVLEALAIQLAGHQGCECPSIVLPWISVFAADHGIAQQGVSAYPAVVTAEMVKNFSAGGAAITVLARAHQAAFEVVDVGVLADVAPLKNLVSNRVAAGTFDFSVQPAMTPDMLQSALHAGEQAVARALAAGADVFVGGEMGIGNTSSAAAMIAQLCAQPVAPLVGLGTGINAAQKAHKIVLIEQALQLHAAQMTNPMAVLRCVGGLEIAALVGAYFACAQHGLTMVIDGVIACAAALVVCQTAPQAQAWMVFGHRSVEPAQMAVFKALKAQPVLDLQMRLGEGSGAMMAVGVLKMACVLHQNMATFEQAGVSHGDES